MTSNTNTGGNDSASAGFEGFRGLRPYTRIGKPWNSAQPYTPCTGLAAVQAILDRRGITRAAIAEHIKAERAGIESGAVVPISSGRRAGKSVRDPN